MEDLQMAAALVPTLGLSTPSHLSSSMGRGRSSPSSKTQHQDKFGKILIPYVVTVNRGEDILDKISSISGQGSWSACILSATGSLCNVALRRCGSSDFVTYEGCFEIVSLSGNVAFAETNGVRCRTAHMILSMAGPDNCVFGGEVAGLLLAASPIQVVLGSLDESASNEGPDPAPVSNAGDTFLCEIDDNFSGFLPQLDDLDRGVQELMELLQE